MVFRDIERLRRTTDSQRQFTLLFYPQFLFNDDGEPLASGDFSHDRSAPKRTEGGQRKEVPAHRNEIDADDLEQGTDRPEPAYVVAELHVLVP